MDSLNGENVKSDSRNPTSENTNETTPPPSTHIRRRHHRETSHARHRGDDSQEPYYFLSEPSMSEEGSSSQYTGTPASPMNGADITMINSPSNTSLSSLGSPGGTGGATRKAMMIRKKSYFTKNPIGQFESSLGPMEEVLNSSLEEQEIKNDDEGTEEGGEIKEDKEQKVLASENMDECIRILSSDTDYNDNFEMFQHSKDGMSVDSSTGVSSDEKVVIETEHKPVQVESLRNTSSMQTPESARYHTAVESPDNEDEDKSNSSFDESSSEEEKEYAASKSTSFTDPISPNSGHKPHFLNEPLANAEQLQNAEDDDKIVLLHDKIDDDEHQSEMDMSSILSEAKISPPIDPLLLATPPSKTSLVDDSILPDDQSVTPKRKTISRHSSVESIGIMDLTSRLDEVEDTGVISLEDSKAEHKKCTPRKANLSDTEKKTQHRRKRSGDIAAASIYAGGPDWVGMEHDKIPLPDQRGIDDDIEYFDNAPNFFTDSRRRFKKGLEASVSDNPAEMYQSNEDISAHFSPRITLSNHKQEETTRNPSLNQEPYLRRNDSFGDRSTSSHDSESNFSWISQRTFQTRETVNGGDHMQENVDFSSQTRDTNGSRLHTTSLYSADDNGPIRAQQLLNSRSDHVSKERSESLGLMPPPLERQLGIENEINHFQSRVHIRSKSDDSGFNSVASAKCIAGLEIEEDAYPTYTCPRCGTKQREFFTVASVHKDSKGGSGGWMVVIFISYMIGALFLFGWEEGWPKLDCFYFSVMTLTTTGPGDYVPVDDSAKIICSIFIYFGICCIGLSLGYLQAHALDDAARKTADDSRVLNCPTCNNISGFASPKSKRRIQNLQNVDEKLSGIVWDNQSVDDSLLSDENNSLDQNPPMDLPMDRPFRTRHQSLLSTTAAKNIFDPGYESYANRIRNDKGSTSRKRHGMKAFESETNYIANDDDASSASSLSLKISASEEDIFHPVSRMRAAKYIFLTMKQAFANSLFVIAIGSVAFYFIEGWTAVDAFYYTCNLFTTLGFGDIVPVTSAGKFFAGIYGLIATVVLLQILSMVSMIPLELRKRRIENSVLLQFGDELDDEALSELAFGPLMRRLELSEYSPEGLGQCTREMFSLGMLIRLGKITEQDVRSTFAAFRKLDRDNDGLLTSREIIMTTVERRKRAAMKEEVRETMGNLLPQKRVRNASPIEPHTVSETTGLLAHSSSEHGRQAQYGMEVENGDGTVPHGLSDEMKHEMV